MNKGRRNKPRRVSDRPILEMTASQARKFLLKPESYCNVDLPPYFQFGPLLTAVSKRLSGQRLDGMSSNPRDYEGVNYRMLSNKDGRYAWRPFQLLHPALYVCMVDAITSTNHWETITERFKEFQQTSNLKCLSIPLQSQSKRKDKAAQILNWWNGIEQGSIELAMEYSHLFHADITDCYAAIYTHSIAWAIHGKDVAKANRIDKTLIGNIIDARIQDMQHGQTNGIPQGSVLMDFVAEIVLGYADLELASRLSEDGITKYRILRYRDDYRVFVNNPRDGETILKTLTEVLVELGLKLNAAKTGGSSHVVSSSVKADKLSWLRNRHGDRNLEKHLLIIHAHGSDFPNSGSLVVALTQFHRRVDKYKANLIQNVRVLISIIVDIAYSSPRTIPVCAAIISKLLTVLDDDTKRMDMIDLVHAKLSQLPNTGPMEIWLQRIRHPFVANHSNAQAPHYKEALCHLVEGKVAAIWNNNWITSKHLKNAIGCSTIVDRRKLDRLAPVVRPSEIEVFAAERY
ncbi:MAG: RNA-directed DNA polymerase [Phycisphaerae bacterium]